MAALTLMITNHRNQLAAVVNALSIVEQTIPIIPFGASVHKIPRHHVKRSIRPAFKSTPYERSPTVQSILSVAHVNEGKGFHPSGGRSEFSRLSPAGFFSVANRIDIRR